MAAFEVVGYTPLTTKFHKNGSRKKIKYWTISGTLGLAFIVLLICISSFRHHSQNIPRELWVDITLLNSAVDKGAVCLDGSPPGYHLQKGSGAGVQNWVVHLEGGAWCSTHEKCMSRSHTHLGSSTYMEKRILFGGILSNSDVVNPDFCNWNRVIIRYCDGASFSGDINETIHFKGGVLYYRGQRIWHAVIEDLLSKGMEKADKVFLTGCSAGGLASIIHCNDFRELLPSKTKLKCLSDGGFFLDAQDISGSYSLRTYFKDVVTLQHAEKSLPKSCISQHEAAQCFLPQYQLPFIQTPMYILNPAYDIWQIQNVLVPDSADQHGKLSACKMDPVYCSTDQLEIFQGFRKEFLRVLSPLSQANDMGLFINSCFAHCQAGSDLSWNGHFAPRVNNKTIAESVGDWYFQRRVAKDIDCAYPCNLQCRPWIGWRH